MLAEGVLPSFEIVSEDFEITRMSCVTIESNRAECSIKVMEESLKYFKNKRRIM